MYAGLSANSMLDMLDRASKTESLEESKVPLHNTSEVNHSIRADSARRSSYHHASQIIKRSREYAEATGCKDSDEADERIVHGGSQLFGSHAVDVLQSAHYKKVASCRICSSPMCLSAD